MDSTKTIESVNIRPGVSILSILRHLNYRPWFAIAEFVDNSLQSFIDNRKELESVEGENFKLNVEIRFDPLDGGKITIRDNAAGIHESDYERAFRPAELPPDQTGLCEFGMGMKSAACWFAPNWIVRSKAIGEGIERTVEFDIAKIVNDNLEELRVKTEPSKLNYHYTEITLLNLHKIPQSRTILKIKEHLSSIYRTYLQSGLLQLKFDGDELSYSEPKILQAPYFKNLTGESRIWKKNINFDFGLGLSVKGFAALRETASVSGAGFALFRRGRLIEGSADEGYRPEKIFGKSNSYRYQRLFGELHLEGFEVSHTKDGFRWEEYEEVFLDLLKEELDKDDMPLLEQAEGYRVRQRFEDIQKEVEQAATNTANVVKKEIPPILEKQITDPPESKNPPKALITPTQKTSREIIVVLNDCEWKISIELSNDPSISEWVSISDQASEILEINGKFQRKLGIRLSLSHPFTERFGGTTSSEIEPLLRLAVAIGLAETTARDSGVKMASTFRRNINQLLRDALSKP